MPKLELFASSGKKLRRTNSLVWIFEPLEDEPDYMQKPMFGCQAAYLADRLCLVVADRGAPWNGLLVCTSREHHAELMQAMQALRPHEVLGKWLYVPQDAAEFESVVESALALVLARDDRVGVQAQLRQARKNKNPA